MGSLGGHSLTKNKKSVTATPQNNETRASPAVPVVWKRFEIGFLEVSSEHPYLLDLRRVHGALVNIHQGFLPKQEGESSKSTFARSRAGVEVNRKTVALIAKGGRVKASTLAKVAAPLQIVSA